MKCAYEDKECSSACIHTRTCAKWKLKNGKAPCRDCTDRSEGCHASCKKYNKWLKEKQSKNAEIRKKRERERVSDERKMDGIKRMSRRRIG